MEERSEKVQFQLSPISISGIIVVDGQNAIPWPPKVIV